MADLKISQLPELLAAQLAESDPLPLTDLSGSETKKISAKNLFIGGVNLLPDKSIPADKVDSGDVEIADGSITAAKLASNSANIVAATLPASGGYVGQQCVVTGGTEPVEYTWNGSSWLKEGGVFAVEGSTANLVNTYISNATGTATVSADIDDTSAAGQFLAGPTGSGGAVSQRVIVSTDLPTAGAQKGAVAVSGNGLGMDGDAIKIDNAVTKNTAAGHLVQYDEFGLVTGGDVIGPGDLPVASGTQIGAIRPGDDFAVTADGELTIANTIAPGTASKVRWNDNGLIVEGLNLLEEDIPDLSTDKITTGDFPPERIRDSSISANKLADYSTVLMQEVQPGTGAYLGQLWWQPSTAQLRVYARGSGPQNIWMPVGFGVLQQSQLRWGGTYDASNGQIVMVTPIGTSAGLNAGEAIPSSESSLTGVYLLCVTPGNNVDLPDVSGKSHDAGDWIVALEDKWVFIDVISGGGGGGGGGGAKVLNDLLDVQVGGTRGPLEAGQLFQYQSDGLWKNVSEIDGGSID